MRWNPDCPNDLKTQMDRITAVVVPGDPISPGATAHSCSRRRPDGGEKPRLPTGLGRSPPTATPRQRFTPRLRTRLRAITPKPLHAASPPRRNRRDNLRQMLEQGLKIGEEGKKRELQRDTTYEPKRIKAKDPTTAPHTQTPKRPHNGGGGPHLGDGTPIGPSSR